MFILGRRELEYLNDKRVVEALHSLFDSDRHEIRIEQVKYTAGWFGRIKTTTLVLRRVGGLCRRG